MTNKEHLSTISSEDWCMRVDWLFHSYRKQFTDSMVAVIHWLDQEYAPVKPIKSNMVDNSYDYCPVCYSPLYDHTKCYRCLTDIDWKE